MSRYSKDLIRIKIAAMGAGEFEGLICELLPKVYPGYEKLEPSFNAMGKTTKGCCDAHAYHEQDDTYTAIVCTTQQRDLKQKLLSDIDKQKKSKFVHKLRRVLICVNTPVKDEVEEYRAACASHGWKLELLSLQRITEHVMGQSEILWTYFDIATAAQTEVPRDVPDEVRASRRFDCGARVKEVRADMPPLTISQLIESIDFPSERQWMAIESEEEEVSEHFLAALAEYSGVSLTWLKHGLNAKYLVETLYHHQFEKIEATVVDGFLSAYMLIEPESMNVIVLVQCAERRWKVFSFGFSMDFWQWLGDSHEIPRIFEFLKRLDQKLRHPHGRIITGRLIERFWAGSTHPGQLLKETGHNSYWFDDLFDLHHRYPIAQDQYQHHGEWFVKLQAAFRAHVKTQTDEVIAAENG